MRTQETIYTEFIDENNGCDSCERFYNEALDEETTMKIIDMFGGNICRIPHFEKSIREIEVDEDGYEIEEISCETECACTTEQLAEYFGIKETIIKAIVEYNCFHKSPYGNSFYNSDNISWGFKPENSIRISDHWSFESREEIHCKVEIEGSELEWRYENDDTDIQELLVCKYQNGMYHVLESL